MFENKDNPEAQVSVADQHGAVDLSIRQTNSTNSDQSPTDAGQAGQQSSQFAQNGANPPGALLNAPLESEVTQENLQEIMGLSVTVPVLLFVYSSSSLASKQTLEVMERSARQAQGAFHLAKLDAKENAMLAQALQLQVLPACLAILANQPIPLFEGVASDEQIKQVVDQILQLAPQMGVTGRLAVSSEELETPIPPEHEDALAAEKAQEWQSAAEAWRKVLANSPRDVAAEKGLAKAELMLRQERELQNSSQAANDPLTTADLLFTEGRQQEAFDLVLAEFEKADAEQREQIRLRLVDMFKIADDPQLVKRVRQRLSTLLMI